MLSAEAAEGMLTFPPMIRYTKIYNARQSGKESSSQMFLMLLRSWTRSEINPKFSKIVPIENMPQGLALTSSQQCTNSGRRLFVGSKIFMVDFLSFACSSQFRAPQPSPFAFSPGSPIPQLLTFSLAFFLLLHWISHCSD